MLNFNISSVLQRHSPVCEEQQAGQLHASLLVDVNVEEELSLQLPDLLLGVRTALLPPHAGLCGTENKGILVIIQKDADPDGYDFN